MKPLIKTENLNVSYLMGRPNQVNAVINANLEIYPGEFIIFFGPSGCGKSTLLYAIAGLERNIQGDIMIDGKNLAKFNNKELDNHRQHTIGMIFQAYYLISSLNVLNNIILPQFSLRTNKKERESKALELLNFFGVKAQAGKFPNELSGGQQQRVAICRSLMNDPEIILADEPTGNLDSKSALDVMNLLLDLNEKNKKTVILVTHSPGGLEYAHRVFYMKDGKIIDIKSNRPYGAPVNRGVAKENVLSKDLNNSKEDKKLNGGTGSSISRDLELLARTYSNFSSSQLGNLLIPFKAKQIVSEVLTSMSNENISKIEKQVSYLLRAGLDRASLFKFLDQESQAGGIGLDSRTARKMADGIYDIILEIKRLEKEEIKLEKGLVKDNDQEVKEIREYLFEAYDVKIYDSKQLERINVFIKQRLKNEIDGRQFFNLLDASIEDNGANIDSRLARKLARRLELLILGKFK